VSAPAPAPAAERLPVYACTKTHVRAAELFADWYVAFVRGCWRVLKPGRRLLLSTRSTLMLVAGKPA